MNAELLMNNGHNGVGTSDFVCGEGNRLLASDDNGFVTNYWYDADGERTVKTSGEGEQIYVNSEFAGGRTNTAKFSLYVSPYLVANQGGRYTKHIYIGSQRIVSKLGDLDSYGSDPRRIPYAGSEADAVSIDYKTKYASQQQVIKDNDAAFDVPYNGEDNNDYVDGEGFCCNDGSMEAAQTRALARAKASNFQDGDAYEKMQFYYHPDHLGSSSYITDLDGEVVQHIEYVPFGEVFIEERNNTWNTPYLFNAKEFDEETGMYYYGARYYEPRLSLWLNVDRFAEKYPYSSPYIYCLGNPLIYTDINGDTLNVVNSQGHYLFTLDDSQTKHSKISFAEIDRTMLSYRSGGSGDWKANGKPGGGYLMVEVEGIPYWTDAIGQIPFALNEYRNIFGRSKNSEIAARETIEIGKQFGNGSLLNLVFPSPDNSNGYDNAMIQRAINWAKKRYKLTPIRMSNGHYEMGVGKTNYSPRNMRVYTTKRK